MTAVKHEDVAVHKTAINRSALRPVFSPRLPIGWRLALAFVAVVVLAISANVLTARSIELNQTRLRRIAQHQPVVQSAQTLAAAAAEYERAVLNDIEAGTSASSSKVEDAAKRLRREAQELGGLGTGMVAADVLRNIDREVRAYEQQGRELARLSALRRELLGQYWLVFDAIKVRITAPVDKAWKIIGHIFARQSLVDLNRSLDNLRPRASDVIALDRRDSASVEALTDADGEFRATLVRHSHSLSKSQGPEWVANLQVDFDRLIALEKSLFELRSQLDDARRKFQTTAARLSTGMKFTTVTPASFPMPDPAAHENEPSRGSDHLIAWISAAVVLVVLLICCATVLNVVIPVRRLIKATQRLACGDTAIRVPRGGIRELDLLGASFNQMAERLAAAEAAVRGYQAQLEAKVDERTQQLQHLAEHDPLTQLPNRRHLFNRLEATLRSASRANDRVGLLFLDLDNFKTINDSLGHEFGDRVLMSIGERLRTVNAECGFRARLGGDEFTVVCEDAQCIADVAGLAATFIDAFHQPLHVAGRELLVSVSIGASVFPDHASNAEALLRAADAALFKAKELGRNQFCIFTPELLEDASSRFRIEQALRRAVDNDEFELVYQPEISFDSLQITAVEALLRWRLPNGDYRLPGEFLPVAEQSGLITEISDFVVRRAISTAAQLHHGRWPNVKVAVNVSARQLLGRQFVDQITGLLREYALPPQCLEVELTENVLQTGPATIEALHHLRSLGVSIALDDFGTGYSSLTSLEQLPLTRVKIDRSLIACIDSSARSVAIVRSIIGLCRSLGLEVTAEGVERPSQLALLSTSRGLQLQGFLLSKPLFKADLERFLDRTSEHLQELLITMRSVPTESDSTGSRSVRLLRSIVTQPIAGS